MTKIRYDLLMDREIENLRRRGVRPRLLLHVCCAPCSTACLEKLTEAFEVTCFYYNPNIEPEAEFERRFAELVRLTGEMPMAGVPEVVKGAYEHERFFELAKGLEDVPEGGERCTRCYRLRLEETARAAKAGGYDYFTTTLSVSPYKNAEKLNRIGAELAEAYGVPYLFSDFKKYDGYLRSIRLSGEYHLYRQDYCGCVYSKAQAEKRKRDREASNPETKN
ncbi:MAG: epoxyqueuosine reductase QueH [Clostridia bacterium]|nr:epoxyqueuosine reductase QueH [Clostridia bacterium]